MIGDNLLDYIEGRGLKSVDGEYLYGKQMGYILTFKSGSDWLGVCFSVSLNDNDARSDVKDIFDDNFKRTFFIKKAAVTSNEILVIFDDIVPKTLLDDCIESICKLLDDMDIHGAEHCSVCDERFDGEKPVCDVSIDRHVAVMHEDCFEKLLKKADTGEQKLHVRKGILGAVIGGILGAMPWVAAVFFGYVNIASVTAFFIPLAAQNGYDAFNGRRTKANIWIVAVASFFFVIFMEYYMSVFVGVVWLGGYKPFWDIVKEVIVGKMQTPEAASATLTHLFSGWVAAGVGSLLALRNTILTLQNKEKPPVKVTDK